MRRKIRQLPLFFLALLFILEAWLWDVSGVLVRRFIRLIPFDHIKAFVTRRVEHLSPWGTLSVFTIPVVVLFPLKVIALYLLAHGYVLLGIGMIIFAKLVGLGVTSFLFMLCKPKLLQLRAINWLYHRCHYWRERALAVIHPYRVSLHDYIASLRARFFSGGVVGRLRSRIRQARGTFTTRP